MPEPAEMLVSYVVGSWMRREERRPGEGLPFPVAPVMMSFILLKWASLGVGENTLAVRWLELVSMSMSWK